MATLLPQPWLRSLAASTVRRDRILVVIQLSGGNDGLSTVVPFKDPAYYTARPKLAIKVDDVVKLNDQLGLNPALRSLEACLADGRMSIVQGVGYAQPNRSHFESMDIWHTGQRKSQRERFGWIGRWLSQEKTQQSTRDALDNWALHLGHEQQPLALASRDGTIASIASMDQFRLRLGDRESLKQELLQLTRQAREAAAEKSNSDDLLGFVEASSQTAVEASERLEKARRAKGSSSFPDSQLGKKLETVAQLIASELDTRIYYVTLDGFDTHAQQSATHTALLRQWADALHAFHDRLQVAGHGDRVLAFTFSEFGRRVAENASDGTDHGAAAPVFLTGPKLTSPVIGAQPSLTDLDDGDLKFQIDFRSIYATIISRWFESKTEVATILGDTYPLITI